MEYRTVTAIIGICNGTDKAPYRKAHERLLDFVSKWDSTINGQVVSIPHPLSGSSCLGWQINLFFVREINDTHSEWPAVTEEFIKNWVKELEELKLATVTHDRYPVSDAGKLVLSYLLDTEGVSPNYVGKVETIFKLPVIIPQFAATFAISSGALTKEVAYGGKLLDTMTNGVESCLRDIKEGAAKGPDFTNFSGMCMFAVAFDYRLDVARRNDDSLDEDSCLAPGLHQAAMDVHSFSDYDILYSLSDMSVQNHANRYDPKWQTRFWGGNYDRLLKIKSHYDPDNLFWCRHCVGSEASRKRTVRKR
eukprot:Nk52_evm3s1992 gene=Nk52_evmTU3s1992